MKRQAIQHTLLIWIACVLSFFCSFSCFADVQLDENFTEQRLAPEISYICGKNSTLSLDEVKALNFAPLKHKEISFGFTQSDCWFHFRATNISVKPIALVL